MLVSTRKLGQVSLFAFCASALLSSAPAWADLKIVSKMSIDSPMMNSLPAQAKAQMASMMQLTTYVSGKKVCISTPMYSVVIDEGNKTQTMISPMQKTYSQMPYSPAMAQQMMSGGMPGAGGPLQGLHVEENTAGTTTFLGHKVRDFVTTGTMSMGQMGSMTIHADTLYAQDLPAADMATYSALSAGAQPGMPQVTGIPLKVVSSMTGGPMGSMTVTMEATSVSSSPVPSSIFAIPNGYTKSDQPAMPGGPMPGMAPPPTQ